MKFVERDAGMIAMPDSQLSALSVFSIQHSDSKNMQRSI
jgi:hypothetical protein